MTQRMAEEIIAHKIVEMDQKIDALQSSINQAMIPQDVKQSFVAQESFYKGMKLAFEMTLSILEMEKRLS